MIEAIDLTVRRRGRTVLDAVSFDVRPGQVTGVLGGTGAGKTVLLRRMVELERGRGETLFDGRPYSALRRPMREVGLLLDPAVGDPDRTVRGYLRLALATDRGAAREGVLAGARGSDVGGGAPRHERGGAFGNVDNWHAVGERVGGGHDRADARVRDAARGHDGADARVRDVARGYDGADGRVRDAARGHGGADSRARFGGDHRGSDAWGHDGESRLDSADGRARNATDLTAPVNCLDIDADDRAEFADVLAACGEFDESCTERDEAGSGRTGARRRRHSHGRAGADDSSGRGWRLGFGGRRHHDESDLADRIEASRRGRPADRIEAVLDIVGLTEQSRTRLSDLTEGMATRLGIAVALLGDPKTLLLDCPDRALEPEGVAWLGALLRAFTGQGRAALVTSSDTETLIGMVDRVLLLDSGYLVGTRTAEEVLRAPTGAAVVVRSPQIVRFAAILAESGARSTQGEGACLEVRGLDRARVGDLAYRHNIPVHELSDRFTGSDPGDLVLAACTGRRARPVVPIQGFPDGKRVVTVPTPVSVGTSAPMTGVRSWGAKALRPARVGGARGPGEPVSNVRVMRAAADADGEPSVRLITVPSAKEGAAAQAGDAVRAEGPAAHAGGAARTEGVARAGDSVRTEGVAQADLAARRESVAHAESTGNDSASELAGRSMSVNESLGGADTFVPEGDAGRVRSEGLPPNGRREGGLSDGAQSDGRREGGLSDGAQSDGRREGRASDGAQFGLEREGGFSDGAATDDSSDAEAVAGAESAGGLTPDSNTGDVEGTHR